MARKWTIGSYSKFVAKLRKEDRRLTKNQARRVYHSMKRKLGRNVFAADIDRHPNFKNEATENVMGDRRIAESVIQDLIVGEKRSLQNLVHKHYGEPGYDFNLERNEILKVSINTTKTRKKFSVRIS